MRPLPSRPSGIERVKFLNELRDVVGRKRPKNKAGYPLVSDYDMIMSTKDERAEAWKKVYETAPAKKA